MMYNVFTEEHFVLLLYYSKKDHITIYYFPRLFDTEHLGKKVWRNFVDRRQRKTRERILKAFTELLSHKKVNNITVGEIIERADVGRATFYSHFPTKDFLVKELNEELFCHIFDSMHQETDKHRHIFYCDEPTSAYLHLFKHLVNNDNEILYLLSSPNNELFLKYFKDGLVKIIKNSTDVNKITLPTGVPMDFMINHRAATFVETVRWWIDNKRQQSAEEITRFYLLAINESEGKLQ